MADASVTEESNDALMRHTLGICAAARAAGLLVTPAREIDVFRALKHVNWAKRDDYSVALRANLVSSRADEILFDRVFRSYWGEFENEYAGDPILARSEMIRGSLEAGRANEAHRDMLTDIGSFGVEDVARRANLSLRWDPEAPPLEQLIRDLARRLATRPSRRKKAARAGPQLDLRRSVRRNARYGFDFIELARNQPKTRKTRIVLLCDVSGSMDAFNPFLLQLMFGLQQALKNSRTVVFSTKTSEISALLRRRSVAESLAEIAQRVGHWSGGTDIGAALAELNRGILREGSARATVLIVISDGYDNGAIQRIEAELQAARRRIRTLVWINPMFGASTFSVRAAGMKAAMPYIDHFLPAFNARALHTLVKSLAELR